MVLFNEKKYACETCIKGHRSSGCKHTDRALYEIKKKGRPVTQCEQCRELRKTKQVHVKCICPKGEGSGQASNSNLKGLNKTLQKPAFPNGLPQASIAVQHLSESSSDSEYGCSCRSTGGDCHCSLSRKASRNSVERDTRQTPPTPAEPFTVFPSRSSDSLGSLDSQSSTRGRVPDFRNVVTKSYCHEVSPGSAPRHNLHQHENTLYSPYGRAYDYAHPNHPDLYHPHPSKPQVFNRDFTPDQTSRRYSNPQLSFDNQSSSVMPTNEQYGFGTVKTEEWDTFQLPPSDVSVCGSDDPCTCPTCVPRNPNGQINCAQPDCGVCYGSVYSSSQAPPNTALSIYNNNDENGVIDAWIKQVYDPIPSNKTPPSRPMYAEPRPMFYNANGAYTPYPGRIRTSDELSNTFEETELVDIKPSLNPGLLGYSSEFNRSEYNPGLQFGNVPNSSSLNSRLGMGSLSAEFAGVGMNRTRSGSTSTSEASTSESEASERSGLSRGGVPVSMYYQQVGTRTGATESVYSSYAPCSSPGSLPDSFSYF
ncbi:hypothetical protein F5879DRAFT_102314 [Lentinula edodes]|nr:hypothetical protein F5879DRAFT_102314 [Lentinula edodes]